MERYVVVAWSAAYLTHDEFSEQNYRTMQDQTLP